MSKKSPTNGATTEAPAPEAPAESFALNGEISPPESSEGGKTTQKPSGRRMVLNAEIAAMQEIADILQHLDERTRNRVMTWVNDCYAFRFEPTGAEVPA